MAIDRAARVHTWLLEGGETAYLANGFEAQILGVALTASEKPRVVYDQRGCIEHLVSQGMTYEGAEEYFDFNTLGAYVGPTGPVFLVKVEDME